MPTLDAPEENELEHFNINLLDTSSDNVFTETPEPIARHRTSSTIHSIKMGNLKVLLDSGADANFAPEKIKLYFPDSIVEPLHPPVHANMAN